MCTSTLYEMVNCQSLTTGELWQADILARDVVETITKRNYFNGKYNFPMICHKIVVSFKKI